jgi:hypothetical protein
MFITERYFFIKLLFSIANVFSKTGTNDYGVETSPISFFC